MKSANIFFDRSYGYARAIVTLIGGLVLVIWPDIVQKWVIIILGALILAVGIASLIISYTGKWSREKVPLLLLNSIVDIAFGLVLLFFSEFFAGLIMFVFGLLLLVFGLGEIVNLARTRKIVPISPALYIGPCITTVVGIVLFFFPKESGKWLFILFGATLLLYALSEFVSTYLIRREMRKLDQQLADSGVVVEDVEAEEVDS